MYFSPYRFSCFVSYFNLLFISDVILLVYNHDFCFIMILSLNFAATFLDLLRVSEYLQWMDSVVNTMSSAKSRSANLFSSFQSTSLFGVSMDFFISKSITHRQSNVYRMQLSLTPVLIRKKSVIPESVLMQLLEFK